nr:xylulose kinase-1 [Tanacetum cinerariifolium]
MVAYLNKSDASEGFDQIIDFLNGSYIKYALTVNPHIYESCIKQFWNTVVVKQSNDVTRLQALVDKKKVVITEATIRDVLRLDDAEEVDCLPNEEIFAELACMGYEKPSTKLTFYKAFFSSQLKFLIHTILQSLSAKRTSSNEFSSAMASAVICLSTEEQVQDDIDDAASQGADTAIEGDTVHEPSIPSPTPPTPLPQQSQDLPSTSQEALDACAALSRCVEHLEHDKVAQALEITKLKSRVKQLERGNKGRMTYVLMVDKEDEKIKKESMGAGDDQVKGRQADIYKIDMDHATTIVAAEPQIPAATITVAPVRVVSASTRRRKGVVIRDVEEESTAIIPANTKSKDKGKGIMDIDRDVTIDHVKQKAKEDPYVQRYQSKEQIEEEENRAIQSINETPAQKAAKRRKLNEEVKELK